jgi:serine phosphatase RsbU (regulator of sigma subunit)
MSTPKIAAPLVHAQRPATDPKSGAALQAVVEQARAALASDTCNVLLLDESGTVLEPMASVGLGGRWRGATHLRIGEGFAGGIALTCQAQIVHEVSESSVRNPILRDAGVRSLLGVPVLAAGRVLGVLHVGSFASRDFTAADVAALQAQAAELAQRLTVHVQDDAQLAALILQRSLLPAAPPLVDGLDMAVRYIPAEGDLGGDWHDVFTLPGGRVGFVMGDVEGHGLHSAVVMGRLRSALRAYALDHDDPAEVLHRLDRKLCHFEPGISASVLYAVSEPPFESITIAAAGHPPPLLASGSGDATQVLEVSGLLLGVDPTYPRTSVAQPLEHGDAVALYTDGLVERRAAPGADDQSAWPVLEVVVDAFSATYDAETACSQVIAAALGDEPNEDDVALLVVRRT